MTERRFKAGAIVPALYILFLLIPIYWLFAMSLRTNAETLGGFSLWPKAPTLANYRVIFTDASWYSGYINSMIYVAINTVISLLVARRRGVDGRAFQRGLAMPDLVVIEP